jgi:hypothetical protein
MYRLQPDSSKDVRCGLKYIIQTYIAHMEQPGFRGVGRGHLLTTGQDIMVSLKGIDPIGVFFEVYPGIEQNHLQRPGHIERCIFIHQQVMSSFKSSHNPDLPDILVQVIRKLKPDDQIEMLKSETGDEAWGLMTFESCWQLAGYVSRSSMAAKPE